MKGEEAAYTINLKIAKKFQKRLRIHKCLGAIKKFVAKHARSKNVTIAPEVNEFLHLHSKNVPQKIKVVLLKKDEKVHVFLQGGKQLEEMKKKAASEKKKKSDEKAAEKKEKEPETKEEKEKQEEDKKKLEDKKQKEKAGAALGIKRKTGKN